ncbi:hypothetical protein SSCG_04964 [Streptomyces clavuligerus]|nr:hypothetical protein SSCG_04964 [Streptomyces clavuligerus]
MREGSAERWASVAGAGEVEGACAGFPLSAAVPPSPRAASPLCSPWVLRVAEPSVRTVPPGLRSPLTVKLSPPGSSPEAAATAPTAMAAEAPSSPVRTGRGVRPVERRCRPICCAFLYAAANSARMGDAPRPPPTVWG